jgi:5'(3')-deoxyribonucleotidase
MPTMRIAIDIDSTLHHYWDTLSAIAVRRFGVELPYDEQFTWGITRLRSDQLNICIEESHSDACILAGTPYPGAIETVRRWHERDGHYIHVTSHRDPRCAAATARWLTEIGLPFDDLCCSWDKISRCAQLQIDVLIDDSPFNLIAALERGIVVATIAHPWNTDVCEEENVLTAADWPELERLLEPLLSERSRSPIGAGAGQEGMGAAAAK